MKAWMKAAAVLSVAFLTGWPMAAPAQNTQPSPALSPEPPPLWRVIGQGEAASARLPLDDAQAAAWRRLAESPRVSGLHLVLSRAQALQAAAAAGAFSIPGPEGSAAQIHTAVEIEHHDEGMVSLRTGSVELGNSASFVVQGADVVGSFQHQGTTWRVDPLGEGWTAVYRYNLEGLRMDPPGWGMRQKLLAPEPRPMDGAGASVEEADSGDTIDLMVVYTPAAAAMGNIDAFIQFALNNTNGAYRNSSIPFRVRLVHKAQVDYTQHADNMELDLDRLTGSSDGYMDEIHGLRDRYGADLVALFVADPVPRGTCGIAWIPYFGLDPTRNFDTLGFSVTGRRCEATDWRIFAHELGHNQGAMHDPYNAICDEYGTRGPCRETDGNMPYRYGRCNTNRGWRTIMAYQETPYGRCPQARSIPA